MAKRNTKKIKRVTSVLTLEDLKRLDNEGIPAKQHPDGLHLKDIHVAPRVFQWRLSNENLLMAEEHIRELARVIQSKTPMKPLDPILVMGVGERFFVVEGHHRLDAYHTAGWKGRVPVEYFEGTIEAAQIEGLKRKNKLPVTRAAKSEAAWRLMVERYKGRKLSWQGIADLTTVHRSTVVRMDQMLKAHGDDVANVTWIEALQNARAKKADEHPEGPDAHWDEWKEKKARKLADYLIKDPSLLDDGHGITARALEMVSNQLPNELVWSWPDAVLEMLKAMTVDMSEEDAEHVEAIIPTIERLCATRYRHTEPDEHDTPETAGRSSCRDLGRYHPRWVSMIPGSTGKPRKRLHRPPWGTGMQAGWV
jgi:ParB-like nuclease domain